MDGDRLHPLHVATFVVVTLAAIFAFIAMRVAFEARDAADAAAHGWNSDDSYAIQELQDALVRAGVIRDPWEVHDDHQELGGPWARCLTAEERDAMGLAEDEVDLPPACETADVVEGEECPEPAATTDDDQGVDDTAVDCWRWYRIEGVRYESIEDVHAEDVTAFAEEWFVVDGTDGVDRLARSETDIFLHVVGEGWMRVHRS